MHARPALACLVSVLTLLLPALAGAQQMAFDLDPGTRVLAPVQFRQLAIFPVVQKAAAAADKARYLTLTDGLAHKQVQVAEQKGGASVNAVTVKNLADHPLLLLGGEVILGGQQDRVISKDTLIPAGQEVTVAVFCVEHGRWSGGRHFTATGGLAEGKLRARAKFEGDQGKVWQQVASKTAALKAETQTGTYRSLATGEQGDKAVKPYRDSILPALAKLPEADRMVGLIAAINGRVTSVDVFESPALFGAYKARLLDSLFLTAADVPETAAAKQAPAPAAIRSFVDQAEAAPAAEVVNQKDARTLEKRAPGVVNSTVMPKASGKAVYRSYQAVE